MKINRLLLFGIVLAGIFAYVSCRKLDSRSENISVNELEAKFFNSHRSSDPLEAALVGFIKGENDKNHFVEKVIKQIGFPYWNKGIKRIAKPLTSGRGASDSAVVVYVPFVRDTQNYVNGLMAIRTSSTDTSFTYLCDWQYSQLTFNSSAVDTSAEGFALFFMMMDKIVFGHTDFVLTDTLLFSDRLKDSDTTLRVVHLLNTSGTAGRSNVLIYEECLQFIVCGSPNSSYCTGPGGCDYLNCVSDPDVCGILEICWEHEIGGGGGGGGGGGNPPGGGGPPECGNGNPQRSNLFDPCGPGWVPIPEPGGGGGGYNPYAGAAVFDNWNISGHDFTKINNWRTNNLDTLGLDSCRKQLLAKLINSLGSSPLGIFLSKLDKAIGIPNTIDKFNIHFLTRPLPNNNALTEHATYDEISKEFEVDIVLDSATSKNATDIFIANSLIHEVIHAYMTFIWKKLNQGATQQEIDSLKYDQVFNAYVDTLRIRDSLNPRMLTLQIESVQHNYMADQLLEFIADIVKQFDNNSSTSERYYWYLAWSGLTRKQVKTWKYHWPNFPTWPPSNPAPSEDSTRGLKYALTLSRIDSIYRKVLQNEEYATPDSKGRKPVTGACY